MQKEQITDKEAICLITIFIMGSTLIIGIGGIAKNDAWIAGIVGIIFSIPILLIYSRVLSLYSGKDLYEILDLVFGKYIGKLVSILYIWYAFHLGALVIHNFGEFINTVTMTKTPMFVPMLCLGLVCIVAVSLGVEVMARTSAFFLPVMLFILVTVLVLAIPKLHFDYLKPILSQGFSPVLKGGFSIFSFPFAETVLFIGVFSSLKTKKSPYKVYFSGLFLAGTVIVILTIRNILLLGGLLGNLYFPSHVAVSRISIGNFLQRIEITVAFIFALGVFIKTSVCLFVSCKGIARLFNLKSYSSVTIQTGLLMIYFSQIVYDNIMDMKNWAFTVYQYYAFPFQVVIPVIIWIFAEVKKKKTHIPSV